MSSSMYFDWLHALVLVGTNSPVVVGLRCDLQFGSTALMDAARNGHDAVVQTLLEWGAAVNHANTVGFVNNKFVIEYHDILDWLHMCW